VTNIRLLPVVIAAVAALLVLKTLGLVTNGGYVLTGVGVAQAAGGDGGGGHGGAAASGETITLPSEPTIEDSSPTLSDGTPTLGEEAPGGHGAPAAGGHGETEAGTDAAAAGHGEPATGHDATAEAGAEAGRGEDATNVIAAENACDPRPVAEEGAADTTEGELLVIPADCPPPTDAVPQLLTPDGAQPLTSATSTLTEQALLERLAARRTELDTYEQELAMRASLVEAAEKRIEERQQTLEVIEAQIATLVEERKEMEEGQFAGIVAMYETMKPKDAATIFNALDIEVLLRVAKMMSPRKMAPILAEMDTMRAQELTVRMASASTDPLDQMAPEALAELPQIVGQ
jgi:flagellar motility protein MotE (MotC chaperone)